MKKAEEILEMIKISKNELVKKNWKKKLASMGFVDIGVYIDEDDHTIISFNDNNLIFGYDEEDKHYALLAEDSVLSFGDIDFTALNWLDRDILEFLLDPTDEKFKIAFKGGVKGKVKIPTVKKRQTAKQKAARKKAGIKISRALKKPGVQKKREKSLKKRKSAGF